MKLEDLLSATFKAFIELQIIGHRVTKVFRAEIAVMLDEFLYNHYY